MKHVVLASEEKLVIPTYAEPPAETMPMFPENRVHQRTSGRPYPNRVVLKTDRLTREAKEYTAIRLENEYLSILILPELGGRIFSAKDKITGYDFFYRQKVIKPALIGMLGSWISGGLEFNWPCHHRPSTFMPVDYFIDREADGSVTVWLSEHDPMERMKGMVGIRLRPGAAILETRVQLTNRTPVSRSFLWWENAAVPVNENYQIFFPPDVSHVNFHYHRSVTTWPLASGVFNGIRLGDNLDIRLHKNTKCPTSYFSSASQYDFFGGYDHGKNCGVVHVANHHTSPGKKLFTWAYNQLSKSWENALTDSDGPYAELMAGSYSDNQPDFAWLEPYETKKFSQYWYPIGGMGTPVCANTNLALSLRKEDRETILSLQTIQNHGQARIQVRAGNVTLLENAVDLFAGKPVQLSCPATRELLAITITDESGIRLLAYTETIPAAEAIPAPWTDLPVPGHLATAQELHLAGVHLDQYRDPCVLPDAYWNEALKRDPEYAPALLDLGVFHYKRAFFREALAFLERARTVITRHNSNPKSGELFYTLGLVLLALGRTGEAYDAFYKATWNEGHRSRGMTMLAGIDGRRGDFTAMLDHAEEVLDHAAENPLAGALAAAAELRIGATDAAVTRLDHILSRDPLNHLARYLRVRARKEPLAGFHDSLRSSPSQTSLDLAYDLCNAGLDTEARELLEGMPPSGVAPMAGYTLGVLALKSGRTDQAEEWFMRAEQAPAGGTFPWRLEELDVLRHVVARNHSLPKAWYYLGNLLYDKGHYAEATECWQRSVDLDGSFYIPYRNLAVSCYSHLDRRPETLPLLKKALSLAPHEEQLIYEISHVMTKVGIAPSERAAFIGDHCTARSPRDEIILEWARALSQNDQEGKALELLNAHSFVACEGGEHAVAEQFMFAHHSLGRAYLRDGHLVEALDHFRSAQVLPKNLGSGLWHEAMLVPHQYYEAVCLDQLGKPGEAAVLYQHILDLTVDYFSNMHLPELPVYQAKSLHRTGKCPKARALLRSALAMWTDALTQQGAGFFKSTPFFISYIEQPNKARAAHFSYLVGLAKSELGDKALALQDLRHSVSCDPGRLYSWLESREAALTQGNPG